MLPKRIMDLPKWGEGPAGAFKPGHTFAISPQDVIIERALPGGPKGFVAIAGNWNGAPAFYSIGPLDDKTLAKVAKIVDDNRGKPLLSIGPIEIPPDEN
jgi:hypothetical protein